MTLSRLFTQWRDDEDGSILIIFALMLAIFAGVVALSYDFGRSAATQSELQSFADNVALAAAGELDAQTDSITRAEAAAATLITDFQSYATGEQVLSGADEYTLTFYSIRPDPEGNTSATTDGEAAGYVAVRVLDRQVSSVFGSVFNALTGRANEDQTVSAYAVAGFTSYACDITPMMFCAPSADFRADENVGMSVQLRSGGSGAQWLPGSFGFLDPAANLIDDAGVCAGLIGNNLDVCLIGAAGNRTGCFAQSGVTIATGQRVGNYEAALNVRFDIFEASANNLRNNPDYPAAPNVLSGYAPANGRCLGDNAVNLPTATGLPPDDCHGIGTCTRFGDADWSAGRSNYVAVNYGGSDPHPTAMTRYDYYRAEIEAYQNANGQLRTLLDGLIRPTCTNQVSDDPARRVFVAASIDCTGNAVSGGASGIPVLEYVEIFMLSPIGLDGTRDVWVELLGGVGGGALGNETDAIVRDVIQLYE